MRSAKPLALTRTAPGREVPPKRSLDPDANTRLAVATLVEETKDMPTNARRGFISAIIALSAVFGLGGLAKADQPPDHHGQVIVESVWVTPAREGGRSTLRFRIVNDSREHVHLLGVETPVAKDAQIIGRLSDHETTTFESINVRADSELDLTTDHMWIEIGPLARAVKAGESIPFELIFVRSRVRAEAHVHGADG